MISGAPRTALFVIDPIEALKPYKDTSVDLMVVAAARGWRIFETGIERVGVENGRAFAHCRQVEFRSDPRAAKTMAEATLQLGASERRELGRIDCIWVRPDPPFDSRYLALTYLLDVVPSSTQIFNPPTALRQVNEKLYATRFADAAPATLVTEDEAAILDFCKGRDRVVLKPVYFGAGSGVQLADPNALDFLDRVRETRELSPRGPVIVQEFLPQVVDGDTRVMIVAGAPVGAIGRKPAQGEFRANIAAGGAEILAQMSPRQIEIARQVGAALARDGVLFAGLDFIGDYLIETNVTSPTLVQQLRRLSGVDVSAMLWDRIEAQA